MCSAISSRPILDDLKKEARQLLHSLHRRDAAAVRRYHSIDKLAGLAQPRLDDAQYVVARERVYGSWHGVYLEKTFTVVGELWMVVLW
jgi:hypothetical protein